MEVVKIFYHNTKSSNKDIEINTIQKFMITNPRKFLEKDHRLDFWMLFYITSGEASFSIDYTPFNCKKGDLIVISKNEVFNLTVNFEVKGFVLFANEEFFIKNSDRRDLDLLKFFETPISEPVMSIDIDNDKTSRQLLELLYKESLNPNSNNKLLKSIFASFVYAIRQENDHVIKKSSIAIYKNYYDYKNLIYLNYKKLKKVSDYEILMNLSKKTINKACRDSANVSAKELINNRVILEAKRLLIQDNLKNYQISYELGFDDPANLATFFKKQVGLSMTEYKSVKKIPVSFTF